MKKKNIICICALVLISIISWLYFDFKLVQNISLIRTNFLNEVFLGLTFVSSEIIIFFFLTSLFLWQEHKRKWILPLWFSLGISAVVAFLLKVIVKRPRPFSLGVSVLPVLQKASHLVWNFSFPSFHAMICFSAVPLLSKEFPKLKYAWIGFAILIAFSRIYFGLHFLSDVILGSVIGYLIGIFVIKLEDKAKFGEKIYLKIFKK